MARIEDGLVVVLGALVQAVAAGFAVPNLKDITGAQGQTDKTSQQCESSTKMKCAAVLQNTYINKLWQLFSLPCQYFRYYKLFIVLLPQFLSCCIFKDTFSLVTVALLM